MVLQSLFNHNFLDRPAGTTVSCHATSHLNTRSRARHSRRLSPLQSTGHLFGGGADAQCAAAGRSRPRLRRQRQESQALHRHAANAAGRSRDAHRLATPQLGTRHLVSARPRPHIHPQSRRPPLHQQRRQNLRPLAPRSINMAVRRGAASRGRLYHGTLCLMSPFSQPRILVCM